MDLCTHCSNEMIEVIESERKIYHGYAGDIVTVKKICPVCGAELHEMVPILTRINIAFKKLLKI